VEPDQQICELLELLQQFMREQNVYLFEWDFISQLGLAESSLVDLYREWINRQN